MADERDDDLERQQDLADRLAATIKEAIGSASAFKRELSSSGSELVNLDELFNKLVETSEDLPIGIVKGRDLQRELIKDSRLFQKVQADTLKLFDKVKDEAWAEQVRYLEEVLELSGEELEQTNEFQAALEERGKWEEKNLTVIKKQFDILQKQAEARKLDQLSLKNITDIVNDLGASIRNPDKAFSSVLQKSGELPSKIFEAAKGSKNLGETMKKLVGPAVEKVGGFAKILFSPAGLLIAGVALAVAAAVGLYKLFKNFWEFMDQKVLPATADFNKQLGATGPAVDGLKAKAISTGVQFELLGMSFQEGAQAVTDVVQGLGSLAIDDKTVDTAIKLHKYVGLSAEATGDLVNAFTRGGGSLNQLNTAMSKATELQKQYGVPVQQIRKDIGENIDLVQRFGTQNIMEFSKSAAKVRQYGLNIKDVNQAFGKQLDTFEGSSDAAAKLNAIFGTTINSMELMMETNPEKRMEMLRKQLDKQGKSWDKLSVFEKNVITQTTGVTEQQAALAFASDKTRKQLERQANQKKADAKTNEDWEKGITNMKRTLINWGAQLDKVMRGLTDFISAIFDFDEPGKGMVKTGNKIGEVMSSIADWLKTTAKQWREGGDGLSNWMKIFKGALAIMKLGFKTLWFLITLPHKALMKFLELGFKFTKWVLKVTGLSGVAKQFFDSLANLFNDVSEKIKEFFNTEIDWWDVLKGFGIVFMESLGGVIDFFKKSFTAVADWFGKLFNDPLATLKAAFESYINLIKSLFMGMFEAVTHPIDTLSKGFEGMFEMARGLFGVGKEKPDVDAVAKGKNQKVNDALITKAGKVVEFNPSDNILATQAPLESMIPKPAATASFDKAAVSELKIIADALHQIINATKAPAAKASQPEIKVEIMDINLDGKKIGEAQVKISRY